MLLFTVVVPLLLSVASALVQPGQYPWPVCYDLVRNCLGTNFSDVAAGGMVGQRLSGIKFQDSIWIGVDFSTSDASESDFTGANMTGADATEVEFYRSILKNVDFSLAILSRANFEGADLTGAVFGGTTDVTGTTITVDTTFPDGLDWKTTSFFATDFRGMSFKMDNVNIANQDFSVSVNVRSMWFYQGSFDNLVANGAKFVGANFTGASMQTLKADKADFSGGHLSDVLCNHSSMKEALFVYSDLRNANFEGTDFTKCDMRGADLRGAHLQNAKLNQCKYDLHTSFDDVSIPSARGMLPIPLTESDALAYDPTDFSWPECYGFLRNCKEFNFAVIAQVDSNIMKKAILTDGQFKNTNWTDVRFHNSKASNSDFTGAVMVGAYARSVNFHLAILQNVDYSKADLLSANFQGADLTGAVFDEGTVLLQATFDPSTTFPDGLDWRTTSFFATGFRGMKFNMDRWNVENQDFSVSVTPRSQWFQNSAFGNMVAHGAKFAGADFTGSWMQSWKADGVDLSGCDLSNIYSQFSSMIEANLTNAILTNAKFGRTNFYRCDMRGADLRGVHLHEATLYECKYDSNTMFDDDFSPAARGMVPSSGGWPKQWPGCYDNGKECDGVNFRIVPYGHLKNRDMSFGSFVGSDFHDSLFAGTNFENATLTNANFKAGLAWWCSFNGATLHNVDLSHADVTYSDFRGADLTGVVYHDKTKFKGARFDLSTVFPDGKHWKDTKFFEKGLDEMRLVMKSANFTDADFSAALGPRYEDFSNSDFWGIIAHRAKFKGTSLESVRFDAMKADDIDFACANLAHASLDGASMKRSIFTNAILKEASMEWSDLQDCVLLGVDLSATTINSATNFCGCTYDQFTKFPGGFQLPACMQYAESASNNTANCPASEVVEQPTCLGLNLAVNGDAESGWREPYGDQGFHADVEAQSEDVYEGNYAFRFRAYSWHTGMNKYVNYDHPYDMREVDCICGGTTVKFEAKIKLQTKTANGWKGVNCDPAARTIGSNWDKDSSRCPFLAPHAKTQGWKGENLFGIQSWDPDGWNTFEVEWTVPSSWSPIKSWTTIWRPNRYSPLYDDHDDDMYMLVDNFKFYVVSATECPGNGRAVVQESVNQNLFAGEICSAEVYGDPHITTFDGLQYDAQVSGEVILLQNSSLTHPTEIHGRFEPIMDGWSASVITGLAMRGNDIDLPVVQVSYDSDSGAASNMQSWRGDACAVQLFIDGKPLDITASKINTGSNKVSVTVKESTITIQYPELLVDLTVGKFKRCLFWADGHLLNCLGTEPITGILGSPNNNTEDDWEGRDGTIYNVPTSYKDLMFKPAFDYVKNNWLILNEQESLFLHTSGPSFQDLSDLATLDYDSTLENLVETAGSDLDICHGDIGCLVDGVTLGKEAAEAIQRNPGFGLAAAEQVQEQRVAKEIRSGSRGDPHFKTWKQKHFEYHGQCDMILAKDDGFAAGLGLEVQIRTKLVRFWSYIKNVSIRIGMDILEIEGNADPEDSQNRYWFNWEYQGELDSIGGYQVTLVQTSNQRRRFEIDLSPKYQGQKIVIGYFKEFVSVDFSNGSEESFGNTVGLLGDFKTGEALARDGSTTIEDFYEYGQEWQVLPSDGTLFHEFEQPQFPKMCIVPEDPRGERQRRLGESDVSEEQAQAACASVSDPLDRKDCIYDVMATADVGMIGAY